MVAALHAAPEAASRLERLAGEGRMRLTNAKRSEEREISGTAARGVDVADINNAQLRRKRRAQRLIPREARIDLQSPVAIARRLMNVATSGH